jgi:hypothetical protein
MGEEKGYMDIGVLPVKVLEGDQSRATFVSDIIADYLQQFPRVRLLEREYLDKILTELKLSEQGSADSAAALRVGEIIPAKYLLSTEYSEVKSTISVKLRLVEAETAKVVSTSSVKGEYAAQDSINFDKLITPLVYDLMKNYELRNYTDAIADLRNKIDSATAESKMTQDHLDTMLDTFSLKIKDLESGMEVVNIVAGEKDSRLFAISNISQKVVDLEKNLSQRIGDQDKRISELVTIFLWIMGVFISVISVLISWLSIRVLRSNPK